MPPRREQTEGATSPHGVGGTGPGEQEPQPREVRFQTLEAGSSSGPERTARDLQEASRAQLGTAVDSSLPHRGNSPSL